MGQHIIASVSTVRVPYLLRSIRIILSINTLQRRRPIKSILVVTRVRVDDGRALVGRSESPSALREGLAESHSEQDGHEPDRQLHDDSGRCSCDRVV